MHIKCVGSGTLCLLALDKQTNVIHALNIGDSGFRCLRNGRIVEKSTGILFNFLKIICLIDLIHFSSSNNGW